MNDMVKSVSDYLSSFLPPLKTDELEKVVVHEVKTVMPTSGMFFISLAGISGALAVALGAYGAHMMQPGKVDPHLISVFETANRYHILHTIALLSMPLMRRPYLVGSLMTLGMILFSGSCYIQALTGSTAIRQVTPFGGMTLIAAWLSMIF